MGDSGWEQAADPLVRAHLEDELSRVEKADPFTILRVSFDADDGAVRRAFLNLTKRYHPNRFARRDAEIRRLANEIFLRFNKAHSQLATEASRKVVLAKHGLDKNGAPDRKKSPTQPKGSSGVPTQQIPQQKPGKVGSGPHPTQTAADTQPMAQQPADRSGATRAAKPATVARTVPGRALPVGKPAPRARRSNSPTQPAPPAQVVEQQSADLDAKRELDFEKAVEALKKGDLASSLEELKRIAAERPGERRYRLYLTYARGRKFQMDRRDDEAAAEYRRAIALEPSFELAKRALADLRLDENDKDKDKDKGGLLKRFFGKT